MAHIKSEVGQPRGRRGPSGKETGSHPLRLSLLSDFPLPRGCHTRAGGSSETPGGQRSPTPRSSEPTCGRHTQGARPLAQLPRLGRCHSVWQ